MLKRIAPLAVAVSLAAPPVFAAMPLSTDDTGTQGKDRFQVEIGLETVHDKEAENGNTTKSTGGELSGTISWGLGDNVDLIAGVPWSWSNVRENGVTTSDNNGFGDLSLQLKWRCVETGDERFSIAVKPGITLPTGDDDKGFGNGRLSGGVTLIATHTGGLGALHLNLGYLRNEYRLEEARRTSNRDICKASLAGELHVSGSVRAVGDIGIETSGTRGDDSDPAFIIGGLIWGVTDDVDLDIGIKGGLNDAEDDTALLAGLTTRF